jgi:hypothetical protein
MKKILTLFVLCVLTSFVAFAQTSGFIESRNSYNTKTKIIYPHSWTSVTAFADTSKSLGGFSYAIAGLDWAELMAGPAYRINSKSYWEIGAGGGFERGDSASSMRAAAYLWQEGKKNTFLFNGEYSPLGVWYIAYYCRKIGTKDKFLAGIYSETAVCTGPRIEWNPTKNWKLWFAGGYDIENKNPGAMFALRWVGL